MFTLDLKTLWQLSKSSEEPTLMHKRIRCGRLTYIVCYTLRDGLLTVTRTKRVRSGCSGKRYRKGKRVGVRQLERKRRQHRSSQTMFVCTTTSKETSSQCSMGSEGSARLKSVLTQTDSPEMRHSLVDTLDLALPVSRDQQTSTVYLMTTGSQTKQTIVERRSTQVELQLKTRWTQCLPEERRTSGTQTTCLVLCHHSFTQTTLEEDEEQLLKPQMSLLNLIMASVGHQSQLLFSCLQSIDQLIELKQLELQKQRLMEKVMAPTRATKATQADGTAELSEPLARTNEAAGDSCETSRSFTVQAIKTDEAAEDACGSSNSLATLATQTDEVAEDSCETSKPIYVIKLPAKRAQLHCKQRNCLHMQRRKIKAMTRQANALDRKKAARVQAEPEPEPEPAPLTLTPTDCKWTQTEALQGSWDNLVAAATQTERMLGILVAATQTECVQEKVASLQVAATQTGRDFLLFSLICSCKWTQTECLQGKLGNLVAAATQTEREKGFLWLRNNN
ncbi:hypothetical protein KR222_007597 [Zaprionus bogoriensis]|nr:hypothetical protein KR222_007597 [Zaprionus bogoriensis]